MQYFVGQAQRLRDELQDVQQVYKSLMAELEAVDEVKVENL